MDSRKTHRKRKRQDKAYLKTAASDQVIYSIDVLVASLNLRSSDVAQIVQTSCERFLEAFKKATQALYSDQQITEFVEACKNRFSDLYTLDSVFLNAEATGARVVVYRQRLDGTPQPYKAKYENRLIVETDDEEMNYFSVHRNPRCYKHLFKGYFDLISLMSMGDQDPDWIRAEISRGARALVSIAKIYEDLRGSDDFIDAEERRAFDRLQQTHDLDHEDEWYGLFMQVIHDINEGMITSPKRYVQDICAALKRVDRDRAYSVNDFHVSFKSTGCRYNGQSLPGLYASIVETDDFRSEVDCIGYTSHYNTSPAEGVESVSHKTITIEQNKPDRRTIQIAKNGTHDRGGYYHNITQDVLDNLLVDCTRDHRKGVLFAMQVTHPEYREKWGNSVYSLDISKATDNLNQEFQELCASIIFGEQRAKFWTKLMTQERTFVFRNASRKKYFQHCGQPQGYKSSFPMFAWAHHIIMRAVMLKNGLTGKTARYFYRLVGDDAVISVRDLRGQILSDYKDCCRFVNWYVSDGKGFIYSYMTDIVANAEFAKVRVVDGVIRTPIPIKLVLNASASQNSLIQLLSWNSKNMSPLTMSDLMYWIRVFYPNGDWDYKEPILYKLRQLELIPVLNEFSVDKVHEMSTKEALYLTLATFIPMLQQTIVDQFLPDHLRGEKSHEKEAFLNTKLEKELLPFIEDMNHKYLQVIQLNIDLINAVNDVFEGTIDANGVVGLQLSAAERDLLITVCDMVSGPLDLLEVEIEKNIHLLRKCIEMLSRFNPRSDVKSSSIEAELIQRTLEFLKKLELGDQATA